MRRRIGDEQVGLIAQRAPRRCTRRRRACRSPAAFVPPASAISLVMYEPAPAVQIGPLPSTTKTLGWRAKPCVRACSAAVSRRRRAIVAAASRRWPVSAPIARKFVKIRSYVSSGSSTTRTCARRSGSINRDCAGMPMTRLGRSATIASASTLLASATRGKRLRLRRVGEGGNGDELRAGADRVEVVGERRHQRDDSPRRARRLARSCAPWAPQPHSSSANGTIAIHGRIASVRYGAAPAATSEGGAAPLRKCDRYVCAGSRCEAGTVAPLYAGSRPTPLSDRMGRRGHRQRSASQDTVANARSMIRLALRKGLRCFHMIAALVAAVPVTVALADGRTANRTRRDERPRHRIGARARPARRTS